MTSFGLLAETLAAKIARAELTTGAITTNPETIAQTDYRTIEGNAWLDPLDDLPWNEPVSVIRGVNDRDLALLSIDTLNPAPSSNARLPVMEATATTREYKLVTQWSRDELRVYAYKYERRNECSSNSNCSGAYTEQIDPDLVNQGLFPIAERRIDCASGATRCRVTSGVPDIQIQRLPTSDILPPQLIAKFGGVDENGMPVRLPISELPLPPSDGSTHRVWVFVGSELFYLDGWQGVFPINPELAASLRETSLPVTVVTPSKWEADINQQARENLRLIYQDLVPSQGQR
jgi:hypothetical protein